MRQQQFFPPFLPLLFALTGIWLLSSSCEQKDLRIVDSIGSAPQVLSVSLIPASVNSDTINVGPDRKPTDLLSYDLRISASVSHPVGQNQIAETQFTFFRTKREPEIARGLLSDNGIFPDSIANDSIFTGSVKFTAIRSEIGTFYAEVGSSDAQEFTSNTIRIPFTILRLNQAPVISNLVAPDTVYRSLQTPFTVSVQASDPDGLYDLVSVTMTNENNSVFSLHDDGINGDEMGGDGIFTQVFAFPTDQPLGPYVFTFKAIDRSNVSSAVLTKTIVVAQ
ncbi:MAG TPA: choice-of-anchor X domain-containing protein [Candidatus Hodarchaeales archaeon]|nr:choice-of-anchor X domain-containing protein [Candidatus Hodarchaeales archaeon]HLE33852.1 choice-of-anchor X domain-containing protein [Bacteroidota bacterium]